MKYLNVIATSNYRESEQNLAPFSLLVTDKNTYQLMRVTVYSMSAKETITPAHLPFHAVLKHVYYSPSLYGPACGPW